MGVRNTCEYSYMKCLYNKPNLTSKNGLKMHKNRFYRHVKIKKILVGDRPNPPYERGMLSPVRAFDPRGTPMAFNSRTTFQKLTTALVMLTQRAFFGLSTRETRVTRATSNSMCRRLDLLNYSHPNLTSGYMD